MTKEDIEKDVKQEITMELFLELDQDNLIKAFKVLSEAGVEFTVKKAAPAPTKDVDPHYIPTSFVWRSPCVPCGTPYVSTPGYPSTVPCHPSPTVVPYSPWSPVYVNGTTGTPPPNLGTTGGTASESSYSFDPNCSISFTSTCTPFSCQYKDLDKSDVKKQKYEDSVDDLKHLGIDDLVVVDVTERLADYYSLRDSALDYDERLSLILQRAELRKEARDTLYDQLGKDSCEWPHKPKKKKKD